VAASHYLALAESKVFGTDLDPRTLELETRLARRRGVQDIQGVLASVLQAATFPSAVSDILDFASGILEYACFLVYRRGHLQVAASTGQKNKPGNAVALPVEDGALGAAIRQGGYFVGPLGNSPADRSFCQALGRTLPRWAFLAPISTTGEKRVFFYADNAERGIATRWVAELSLLTSRLGQRTSQNQSSDVRAKPTSKEGQDFLLEFERQVTQRITTAAKPEDSGTVPEPERPEAEQGVLIRLKQAAAEAGMELSEFVDELLAGRRAQPAVADTSALVGEVRDLFQKLASDIPAQLARGMETAFREMVPRIAGGTPQPQSAQFGARPPASGGIVRKESTAPREVQDYRNKRRKSRRVKL